MVHHHLIMIYKFIIKLEWRIKYQATIDCSGYQGLRILKMTVRMVRDVNLCLPG